MITHLIFDFFGTLVQYSSGHFANTPFQKPTHYPDLIHRNLKSMDIQAYFPLVITSIEFGKRKPHPAIFQEALDRLQIDASQAIYIGDTLADDYLGARNLQIRSILIDSQRAYLGMVAEQVDSLFEIRDLLPLA